MSIHQIQDKLQAKIILYHHAGEKEDINVSVGSLVDFYRYKMQPSILGYDLKIIVDNKNKNESIVYIKNIPIKKKQNIIIKAEINNRKYYGVYKITANSDIKLISNNAINPIDNTENVIFVINKNKISNKKIKLISIQDKKNRLIKIRKNLIIPIANRKKKSRIKQLKYSLHNQLKPVMNFSLETNIH